MHLIQFPPVIETIQALSAYILQIVILLAVILPWNPKHK